MSRFLVAMSLLVLAGSPAWSAQTVPAGKSSAAASQAHPAAHKAPAAADKPQAKSQAPLANSPDAQPKPHAAQPRPPAGPLRPPQVFLPPSRSTPLLAPGSDSGQFQPAGSRRASIVAHRTERHSSTIFGTPAIESPRRFGPVQPVPSGPVPLTRRSFAW
jgi:hypothetical protein